jgi:hypothetical protein
MPGIGLPEVINSTISAKVGGYGAAPLSDAGVTSVGACASPTGPVVVETGGAWLDVSVRGASALPAAALGAALSEGCFDDR